MKVHILQIPAEGLHLSGEEPSQILDLADESVRATGPIQYDLDVGLSDGGLFATGTLEVPLALKCVTCLETFPEHIVVDDFACQVELTGRETVDLTDHLREDILLALPPHPHCDASGERECKGPFPIQNENVEDAASDAPEVWGALDQLKLK